jgi:hypothetical protein
MTYETKIEIQIAGIRRIVRLAFEYHMETVNGNRGLVHDSAAVFSDDRWLPGNWIYHLIGPRQLKELDSDLIKHWRMKIAAKNN